jgi:hypothetical protein
MSTMKMEKNIFSFCLCFVSIRLYKGSICKTKRDQTMHFLKSFLFVLSCLIAASSPAHAGADEDAIRLTAVIDKAGVPVVGLEDMKTRNSALLRVGQRFKGIQIEAIDVENNSTTLLIDGELKTISLRGDPRALIIPLPRINRNDPEYVAIFKPAETFSTNIVAGQRSLKIFTHPDDHSIAVIEFGGKRYAMPARFIRNLAMDELLTGDEKISAITGFPALVEMKENTDNVKAIADALEKAKPPPPPSIDKIPPPPPGVNMRQQRPTPER